MRGVGSEDGCRVSFGNSADETPSKSGDAGDISCCDASAFYPVLDGAQVAAAGLVGFDLLLVVVDWVQVGDTPGAGHREYARAGGS